MSFTFCPGDVCERGCEGFSMCKTESKVGMRRAPSSFHFIFPFLECSKIVKFPSPFCRPSCVSFCFRRGESFLLSSTLCDCSEFSPVAIGMAFVFVVFVCMLKRSFYSEISCLKDEELSTFGFSLTMFRGGVGRLILLCCCFV